MPRTILYKSRKIPAALSLIILAAKLPMFEGLNFSRQEKSLKKFDYYHKN